jgi:hypothetical protein
MYSEFLLMKIVILTPKKVKHAMILFEMYLTNKLFNIS